MRSVVVLPQPDGPTSTHTSPVGHVERELVDRDVPVRELLGDCVESDHGRPRFGDGPGTVTAAPGYGDRPSGARGVRRRHARRLVVGQRSHDRDLATRRRAPHARRLVAALGAGARAPARVARAPVPPLPRTGAERDRDPLHDPLARGVQPAAAVHRAVAEHRDHPADRLHAADPRAERARRARRRLGRRARSGRRAWGTRHAAGCSRSSSRSRCRRSWRGCASPR